MMHDFLLLKSFTYFLVISIILGLVGLQSGITKFARFTGEWGISALDMVIIVVPLACLLWLLFHFDRDTPWKTSTERLLTVVAVILLIEISVADRLLPESSRTFWLVDSVDTLIFAALMFGLAWVLYRIHRSK